MITNVLPAIYGSQTQCMGKNIQTFQQLGKNQSHFRFSLFGTFRYMGRNPVFAGGPKLRKPDG